MHRLNCCLFILALAAFAVTSIGCSGGKATISTEPVEGVVTLDGEPVAEAVVTFRPVNAGEGMAATGKTDANGVYKLTALPTGDETAEPGGGTLPGEYNVGVTKTSFPMMSEDEEEDESDAAYEDKGDAGGEDAADDGITFIVPQKYNNPATSGITKTVTAGENKIDIELTSD